MLLKIILLRNTRVSNKEQAWIPAGGNNNEKAHIFGRMGRKGKRWDLSETESCD